MSTSKIQPANGHNRAFKSFLDEPGKLKFSRCILLIDDNALIVDAFEQALRDAGHEVYSTTRGDDVFRLVNLLNPDLIITDIIMPEIDVIDVITEMRSSRPGVKVIAISGNPHLLRLASKQGADGVLAKPFGVGKLSALVKAVLH